VATIGGTPVDLPNYMHARYYSAPTGRFLSLDPKPGAVESPQSWNLYAYVRNNPLGGIAMVARR
jgi:RHS repeat-associated protein